MVVRECEDRCMPEVLGCSINCEWVIGLFVLRVDRRSVFFLSLGTPSNCILGMCCWGGGVMGKLGYIFFFVPAGRVVVPMLWRAGACSGTLLSNVGVVCELGECGLHLG